MEERRDPEIRIYEDGIDGQQKVLLVAQEEEERCDDDSEYLVESVWKLADTIQKRI